MRTCCFDFPARASTSKRYCRSYGVQLRWVTYCRKALLVWNTTELSFASMESRFHLILGENNRCPDVFLARRVLRRISANSGDVSTSVTTRDDGLDERDHSRWRSRHELHKDVLDYEIQWETVADLIGWRGRCKLSVL